MSRFGRVVGFVGSRVGEFFKPMWRRVLVVVALVVFFVAVGCGGGFVWSRFSSRARVQELANRMEFVGRQYLMEPQLNKYTEELWVEGDMGVMFPRWRFAEDSSDSLVLARMSAAVEEYNSSVALPGSGVRKVSVEAFRTRLGSGLREFVESGEDYESDYVYRFCVWLAQAAELVYADTGERVDYVQGWFVLTNYNSSDASREKLSKSLALAPLSTHRGVMRLSEWQLEHGGAR